jgi:hypothetical protein
MELVGGFHGFPTSDTRSLQQLINSTTSYNDALITSDLTNATERRSAILADVRDRYTAQPGVEYLRSNAMFRGTDLAGRWKVRFVFDRNVRLDDFYESVASTVTFPKAFACPA